LNCGGNASCKLLVIFYENSKSVVKFSGKLKSCVINFRVKNRVANNFPVFKIN